MLSHIIYIFFLRRIYKSISCGYCQVHTIPIPSLYHLYTKSMVTREYLRCTASVPSVFLRPSYTLGIPFPHSTLTRWVCLGYARSLATACLQYSCGTIKPSFCRYYLKTQQLWQGNRAIPRVANSATKYTTPGMGGNASAPCPPLWPTRKPRHSRPTAATSRWSPNSRPT